MAMAIVDYLAILFALSITVKGLGMLLAPKALIGLAKNWIGFKGLTLVALVAGAVILYYATPGVALSNILAIILGYHFILGGILLRYPKVMQELMDKAVRDRNMRLISLAMLVIGVYLLYLLLA